MTVKKSKLSITMILGLSIGIAPSALARNPKTHRQAPAASVRNSANKNENVIISPDENGAQKATGIADNTAQKASTPSRVPDTNAPSPTQKMPEGSDAKGSVNTAQNPSGSEAGKKVDDLEDDFDAIAKKMAAERASPTPTGKSRQEVVEEELQKLDDAERKAEEARMAEENAAQKLRQQEYAEQQKAGGPGHEEQAIHKAHDQLKRELTHPVIDNSIYDWNGLE